MYNKEYYRTTLNELKKYIKLSSFLPEAGISKSNLSYFMKGSAYDCMLSTDKLDSLLLLIKTHLTTLIS